MQSLLAGLYDAPVEHDAEDFLLSDRQRLNDVVGEQSEPLSDEQVFVVQEDGGVRIGLYIDQRVLDRLYLHPRRRQPEKWLAELRRFFRCGHQEKIRQLAV
jgi:hypothetical protein